MEFIDQIFIWLLSVHRCDRQCTLIVLTIANLLRVCKVERNLPQKVSYSIIIHYRIS